MTGVCRKVRYASRNAAKRARREIGDSALRPYRCLTCAGEPFHLGHLAETVRRGKLSRREVYGES